MVSILEVQQDPRFRKLFALIGQLLIDQEFWAIEDRLYDIMLRLAPEFIPPDWSDDEQVMADWEAFIARELRRN